jgi:phage terminase large subunit-like protein
MKLQPLCDKSTKSLLTNKPPPVGGNIPRHDVAWRRFDRFILSSEYDVRSFGYDPYNAKEFVTRWEAENGPFAIEKVIQGAKTESVPLGEIKIMAEERLLIFDQSLMSFAMGNAITLEDTNGMKAEKRRDEKTIMSPPSMLQP